MEDLNSTYRRLILATCIILGLTIVCAMMVFVQTCQHNLSTTDPTKESSFVTDTIRIVYEYADKADITKEKSIHIFDKQQAERLDSLYNMYMENQNYIIENQKDLVNDIRQETNNNLDKMAAWLSFWIAVMALIGTLLPIVLNFILHHREEHYLRQTKEELSNLTACQKLELRLSTLETESACLDNGLKSRCLRTLNNGPLICSRLLHNIINRFQEIIEILENPTRRATIEDNRIIVTTALISIYTSIQQYAQGMTPVQIRQATKCMDRITVILQGISTMEFDNTLNLLRGLSNELRSLAG